MVYREETLLNVLKSVSRNLRSIVLTTVLAIILIYLFSIIGFICFQDDFFMEVDQLAAIADESEATAAAAAGECSINDCYCKHRGSYANYQLELIKYSGKRDPYDSFGPVENTKGGHNFCQVWLIKKDKAISAIFC